MDNREMFTVEEESEGERLDAFIAENMERLSRSMVQTLIKEKHIQVNEQAAKASYRLKEGDSVMVVVPDPVKLSIEPEEIPLNILYQDEDIVVVDKPKGLVVHPAQGNWSGTMVNALLYHIKDLSGINGVLRPGIVHRLDKDTSGVMVVAKNDKAHKNLAEQIKNHDVKKEYMALVHGVIKENLGTIDAPIGRSPLDRKKMAVVANGREAITDYEVVNRFQNYTFVRVRLHTGRTHQIRVHFAYLKHSVVGDPLYGTSKKHFGLESQALHAYKLGFHHPRSGEYVEFESELPKYLQKILDELS
ncbi:MAG: RluA family pseudouridine synthase [Bacillota bacterium]|nr:RluA family pseudouridine synthase [Bacillota bacterium]